MKTPSHAFRGLYRKPDPMGLGTTEFYRPDLTIKRTPLTRAMDDLKFAHRAASLKAKQDRIDFKNRQRQAMTSAAMKKPLA